jgi:hypothetical protein
VKMVTVQINNRTKTGKNALQILKDMAQEENGSSIRFLDETELLLSTEANKEALMHGINQLKRGEKGKTIKPSDLWK